MTRKKTLLALCMGLLVAVSVTGAPVAAFANDDHDKHDKKDHKEGTHAIHEHDDHDHDKKDDHEKKGH